MRESRKKLALLLCALLLLVCAGCGSAAEPEAAVEPTPHAHLWEEGVCALCGERCEHQWEDGVCALCGAKCAHRWRVGVCEICGMRCAHIWRDGVCMICSLRCEHDWRGGVCAICGKVCEHKWRADTCIWCGKVCTHVWKDGVCTVCGTVCEHEWEEGVCSICGLVCPHEEHDAQSGVCAVCGMKVAHEYYNGLCTRCGIAPPFIKTLREFPAEARTVTEQLGRVESFHYSLGEGELLPGAHGKNTREENRQRDVVVYTPFGYDAQKQYNVLLLVPGAGHTAHQWMEWTNLLSAHVGRIKGCDLLDRLIALGKMEPMIVVVAEYYLSGTPAEIAPVFEQDLRERVLPYLAANYGTYASVDENGALVPAPEHFGFVGCSFGSMIGWQMLPGCTDLFGYWGLLSGGYQNDDELTEKIESSVSADRPVLYLYAGDGKQAQGWSVYRTRMEKLSENCSPLEQGLNLHFLAVERVGHDYSSWDAGLYNCLQVFFHSRYDPALLPPGQTPKSAAD